MSEWSEEKGLAHGAAHNGMDDGDLLPLAQYLAAGHPLDSGLAEKLVELILGDNPRWTLKIVGKKRRQSTMTQEIEWDTNDQIIGIKAEKLIRKRGQGQYEAAIQDVMQEFNVSRTTVTNAHARVRKILAQDYAGGARVQTNGVLFAQAFGDHWSSD